MKQFSYVKPSTQATAVTAIGKPGTKIIAGGTNLVDLMKKGVTAPDRLVDINSLPLKDISEPQGNVMTISIGALALNSAVAEHASALKKCFPYCRRH
jgi:xanthine dehydrogenase YagS FAD-binding subunit